MKPHRLLVAVLLLGSSLFANPLAIFSRSDSRAIGSSSAPADPAQAAFYAAYANDRASHRDYDAQLPLINPPAWGKTVSANTGGTVYFLKKFPHGHVCRVVLHDLQPNFPYALCLNGNPKLAGNDLLPTPVPGNPQEKYYDFLDVKSDAHGAIDVECGIFLKPGDYDVRLYVKDHVDHKIVLYHDYAPFTVDE